VISGTGWWPGAGRVLLEILLPAGIFLGGDMGITNLISNACAAVSAVFNWKSLPERRRQAAAKALEKEARSAKADQASATDAVRSGNKDEVNRRVSELIGVALVCASLLACGCGLIVRKPAVVYVAADREVIPMTTNNVAGWFVPNATFDDLLKAAQKAKALEKQQAVTARLDGKQ